MPPIKKLQAEHKFNMINKMGYDGYKSYVKNKEKENAKYGPIALWLMTTIGASIFPFFVGFAIIYDIGSPILLCIVIAFILIATISTCQAREKCIKKYKKSENYTIRYLTKSDKKQFDDEAAQITFAFVSFCFYTMLLSLISEILVCLNGEDMPKVLFILTLFSLVSIGFWVFKSNNWNFPKDE